MRFARVASPHDRYDPALDQLLGTADLDVLQLDFHWSQKYPVDDIYAAGFLGGLRLLHKTIFLDPRLHVITNAGGGSPLGCIEAVAEFLCEHGSEDLPLTLIRGNNLLPRLEELLASGTGLIECDNGKQLRGPALPFLAAHAELGAGPLATALGEGARMVIAGCYDTAAPGIAATVDAYQVRWENFNTLAKVAIASQVPHRYLEIAANGEVVVQRDPHSTLEPNRVLLEFDRAGIIRYADVHCHVGSLLKQEIMAGDFDVSAVTGKTAGEMWRMRLTTCDSAQLNCWVPRDAVAVSVDTRPAHEWK